MAIVIEKELVPLAPDNDGVIRVGGTRVTLDTVIGAFEGGATPEEIALRYTSLQLADIYLVIAYYLRHQAEVKAYLEQEEMLAEQVRQENEARFNRSGIRERLLARRAGQRPS